MSDLSVMTDLWRGVPLRGWAVIAAVLATLVAMPLVADRYVLSVLILIFYFAYVGQAWNLMMGYAGQLSLGHALYVGLGGYVAALLWLKLGIGPWLGVFAAIAVTAAFGAAIGWLGFRFGIAGVYFALLTIAFAEFVRIGFNHLDTILTYLIRQLRGTAFLRIFDIDFDHPGVIAITGGAGGLYLPFEKQRLGEWWNLRGGQMMFYYLALALACGGVLLVALLARSRLGYQWRAVREDEAAARALGINAFAVKMAAVMISSAMTAVGGVFYAFYYNNLLPDQVFGMSSSIELILAPIVGGLGTAFGPVIGAFLLTPLGEGLTVLMEWLGVSAPGAKLIFYGVILIAIISMMPSGVWPRLAALSPGQLVALSRRVVAFGLRLIARFGFQGRTP
jgi:branched-chain amino acid transport system permease protein